MKKIIALTDYKNKFGSKHFDSPYRSGMDKNLLKDVFKSEGFELEVKQITEVLNGKAPDTDAFYIYTSSEDVDYLYKSFIEDAVLFLEEMKCNVIPSYKYMRANNNKVYMELMRCQTNDPDLLSIQSKFFGTKEELLAVIDQIKYPVIIKTAEGASGTGVYKAENKTELVKMAAKVSASKNLIYDTWDYIRALKHKGYIRESEHRKKFIVQNMIPNLKNDWKVYFFQDKIYLFYRPVFKHRDFRASGGGYDNYTYGENAPRPDGLFEYIMKIMQYFPVPHASLDIAWDGNKFHLIEIQFLYFGTAGIPYSSGYFYQQDGAWLYKHHKLTIEEVYAKSITQFINNKHNR